MKDIVKAIGLITLICFSFFYTEKIASFVLESNELYQEIDNKKEEYLVASVNAQIDGEYIIPGLNGLEVNVKDSYFNMKDINVFNEYYLLYDIVYPSISLNDYKDKIIKQGNTKKHSISFILEYDEKIKPLSYYHYQDNEQEFRTKWLKSGTNFGVLESETLILVVPLKDINYMTNFYKNGFTSLDSFF